MIAAPMKPVEQVTKQDLDELVERQWPESENVEFKGELTRGRDRDP